MGDEEPEELPPTFTAELLQQCLQERDEAGRMKTRIERTAKGTYALTHLDASAKEITVLGEAIESYQFLTNLSLAGNKIPDISGLGNLKSLHSLNLSDMDLAALPELDLPWCQYLDLQTNALTKPPSLQCFSMLVHVVLDGNKIESMTEFQGHPTVQILSLRENQLANLEGFRDMPELTRLVLSKNSIGLIPDVEEPEPDEEGNVPPPKPPPPPPLMGITGCPKLELLDLSANEPLKVLDEFEGVESVTELNLAGASIETVKELGKLTQWMPNLLSISIQDTACVGDLEEDDLRLEVLLVLPDIHKFNGEKVTSSQRRKGRALAAQRDLESRQKSARERLTAASDRVAALNVPAVVEEEEEPAPAEGGGEGEEDGEAADPEAAAAAAAAAKLEEKQAAAEAQRWSDLETATLELDAAIAHCKSLDLDKEEEDNEALEGARTVLDRYERIVKLTKVHALRHLEGLKEELDSIKAVEGAAWSECEQKQIEDSTALLEKLEAEKAAEEARVAGEEALAKLLEEGLGEEELVAGVEAAVAAGVTEDSEVMQRAQQAIEDIRAEAEAAAAAAAEAEAAEEERLAAEEAAAQEEAAGPAEGEAEAAEEEG